MKTQLSVCLMLGARAKKKGGFKMLRVGFIEKGIPLSTKVWSITMSPSNCTLCMFFHYFCADDGSYIECVTEGIFLRFGFVQLWKKCEFFLAIVQGKPMQI